MAVVRANYCKRGTTERKIAKANISYIQTRPGRDKERLTRTLFGPSGSMGRREAYQFITDAPPGTYFYRLKLSPDPLREDVKRDLNMQKLTRAMMQKLEKRLKTVIPWAAALHDDHTDIRHVHILAAIPRRLGKYELEFLIREATQLTLSQRRFLDRGVSRLPWHETSPRQRLKIGKYTSLLSPDRHNGKHMSWHVPHGRGHALRAHSSCTCPRCHMPQTHDRRGVHSCTTCGLMLHKKKALTLTLQPEKERGRERSL